MIDRITATVWDAVGSVCADVTGLRWVYAVGVTPSVEAQTDIVVGQADELIDGGLPAIVVGLGPWTVIPGTAQRITYDFDVGIVHQRSPIREVIRSLVDMVDELHQSFEAHAEAKLHGEFPDWNIGSALITGGERITPRAIAGSPAQEPRWVLVASMNARVVVNRTARYQPA